jgi:hypothetical protein
MQNPQIGPITDTKQKNQIINTLHGADMPLGILETLKRPSNQVLQKNEDDSLEGIRYVISTEPSSLRPIRSWTILIEKWKCKTMADIVAEDVLFLRIRNTSHNDTYDYADIVGDVVIRGQKQAIDNSVAFNTIMAAGVLINKIDIGRLPDIDKILRIYNAN